MTTLGNIRDKVRRLLGDTVGTEYSDELLNDGILDYLVAILPWVTKPKLLEWPSETDTGPLVFTLPTDCYRVIGIQSYDGYWIPELLVAVTPPTSKVRVDNDWKLFPEGSVSFSASVNSVDHVTLHYGAYWPMPDLYDPSAALETPAWTHQAAVYHVAGYALLNAASNSANVRQWNIRLDSGVPTHNPMKEMSDHYFAHFIRAMNSHPTTQKGAR